MSQPIRGQAAILLFRSAGKKHKLGRGRWVLASCQVMSNSVQWFQRRSRKCLSQSEARAAILFFWSARKTQFRYRMLWSCFLSSFVEFYSAVPENVSANQRPGWPSCFSDRPEKHLLGRGHWDLASYQVLLNSVWRFQRIGRKCLSQSEARVANLFFRSARKTQNW